MVRKVFIIFTSDADDWCTDPFGSQPRKFLIPVEATLKDLLEREDTDKNMQITIEDLGPKVKVLAQSNYVYINKWLGTLPRYGSFKWLQPLRRPRHLLYLQPPPRAHSRQRLRL
jgi:hypothetical protein